MKLVMVGKLDESGKLQDRIRIVSARLMSVRNGPRRNNHGHKLFLITGNAIYRGSIDINQGSKKV